MPEDHRANQRKISERVAAAQRKHPAGKIVTQRQEREQAARRPSSD